MPATNNSNNKTATTLYDNRPSKGECMMSGLLAAATTLAQQHPHANDHLLEDDVDEDDDSDDDDDSDRRHNNHIHNKNRSKKTRQDRAREEGEETNTLPYVRMSKRARLSNQRQQRLSDPIEVMPIREVASDRLLATKRIVNAFNAGDIEAIHEIIYDTAMDTCEVYFSNLHHAFVGRSALYSLWSSLFEAFPNGIFRTSDSVINEKKQVFTSFLFFGTKIFPLLIDGMPLEILASEKPVDSQLLAQSASVKVDRSQSIFTTAELLEVESVPEMVFEGRIVLHMNEHCKIRKFDFAWNRKM